ncbi:MAG: hypothetical protein IPK58_07025 [Acidobacteria bacterium]|nr:hypothetical protein [Acidobacteriota bacterium]
MIWDIGIPDSRFRIPDSRYSRFQRFQIPDIPDSRFRIPDSGFQISDSRFQIPDFGFDSRILELGIWNLWNPKSQIPNPQSQIPNPHSPHAVCNSNKLISGGHW